MGLHVYAVVPAGHAPTHQVRGLDDGAVDLLDAGAVALWVGRVAARPVASIDAVRRHNAVIEAAMTPEVTPVPARFGQWFDTDAAAVEMLAADEARWLADLARFAGHAEYGVRVIHPTDEAPPAAQDVHPAAVTSGTRYMQALAQRHAEADRRARAAAEVAAAVAAAADGLVADSRVQTVADGVAISHMVAWNDAASYHSAMRREEARRRDLRFVFTGPWPPWSFVE